MSRAGLLIAAAGLALAATGVRAEAPDSWYGIEGEDGQLVGRQHEYEQPLPDGRLLNRERDLAYSIDGHEPVRLSIRVEREVGPDGATRRIVATTVHGQHREVASLEVNGGMARIVRDGRATEVPLPTGATFVDLNAMDGLPSQSGRRWEFDPGLGEIVPLDLRPVETSGERAVVAWREGTPAELWIARPAAGAVVQARQPLLGGGFVFRRSDRPIEERELSMRRTVPHQMAQSPYAIPKAALSGHIRYRLGFGLADLAPFPATGEQQAQRDGDGWRLDVCRDCGPGLSTAPADLAVWTRPAPWLQSDAPQLQAAVRGVPDDLSGRERMKRLGAIARRRLDKVDYKGHASALAAWRQRAGDCTEDATLLAGLARAAGIPARVVNGVVYARERYHGAANAFMPHSWVLAYVDGRWESFDISVGAFDATHIALTVGDGEPWTIAAANQLAGLIEWRDMTEVRTRPAP